MKRITILLSAFLLLTVFTALALATSNVQAASTTFASIPNGYAYVDYESIPTTTGRVTYGPNVPVALTCSTTNATSFTNSVLNQSFNGLGTSGTARSTITVTRPGTSETVQASSDVQNLNLLSSAIKADDIHASVSSTATLTGATSVNNSTFSNLVVAGVPVASNPAPNTRENLPGLGYVIVNEQSGPTNGATATSISVNMLDVNITVANTAGFAVGTRIVIGHADTGSQQSSVVASAEGLYATGLSSSNGTVGPLARTEVSCQGGSTTNSTLNLNSPTVGNTGSETSSASGQLTTLGGNASAQNSVTNLSLLNSLIKADKVTTSASATLPGVGSGSASFQNLTIAGTALPSNPAPNTRQNLAGLGYVIVNEQYGSNGTSSVSHGSIGLDINITSTNALGIAVGARIIVSDAYASASNASN